MRLKEVNYYGFKHDVVNKMFTGGLTYIRTFMIRGHHWAVYRAANPDLSKGHKRYMMLGGQPDMGHPEYKMKYHVSGSTEQEMNEERFQQGVLCLGCDTVLYSINRHHYHSCGCPNETFVDGGKDYVRCGGVSMHLIEQVGIDLVDGTLTERNGVPIMPSDRVKLDPYLPELDIVAKVVKPAKKKRLTSRRKSSKIKKTRKAKNENTHSRK